MGNIKDYRSNEQKMFVVANIFVLMVLSPITVDEYRYQVDKYEVFIDIIDASLLYSAIYIYSFVADSLFSSELKAKLLYIWKCSPGEEVFSYLQKKNTDHRFSTKRLVEKYNVIYENMPKDEKARRLYENEKWYERYNRCRDVPMIYNSNRDYLLCRDLYVSTLIIGICYLVSCCVLSVFSYKCVLYLVAMSIATNVAARIKGRRFVNNVIAYDLHFFSIKEFYK